MSGSQHTQQTKSPRMALGALLLIAGMHSIASAQPARRLQTYTYLRERLADDFVRVGEGPGLSIPVHERHEVQNYVRWADATIRLGWYIGLLASEHHLLSNEVRYPGFRADTSIDAVSEELFFALAALERLDRVAEDSFDSPCEGADELNGFFIRDDVPASFHERFGMGETRSDFLAENPTSKEMSQDQAYHLLLGLALTYRLVPEGTNVRGRDLGEMARANATRIMHRLRGDGDWLIRNPACDNRLVARGAAAGGLSPGIADVFRFFDGDGSLEPDPLLAGLWPLGTTPDSGLYGNSNVLHMAMVVAAIGAGWDGETGDALVALAGVHEWWFYPLLYRVLRGEEAYGFCSNQERVVAEVERMLDELPPETPPRAPYPEVSAHGFSSTNRFIRPRDEHYEGPESNAGKLYNGLDYLLAHNLLVIASPHLWPGAEGPADACTEQPFQPPPPPPDGGMPDGSVPDAGTADAALAPADAGADAGPAPSGGGCSASGHSAGNAGSAYFAILLLVFVARRRSKPRRAAPLR